MAHHCRTLLSRKEIVVVTQLLMLAAAMATRAEAGTRNYASNPGRERKYIVEHNDVGSTRYLGEACSSSSSCRRGNKDSVCHAGVCTCLPYHVAANATSCLPTALLGFECSYHAQCSLRVPNSGCIDGACQCSQGYSPYKRHLCLPPALLGHRCFTDDQCRLGEKYSYCKFIIPNSYGRCHCDAESEHVGKHCVKPNKVIGSVCSTTAECRRNIENSVCIDSTCSCEQGFTVGWTHNQCIPIFKGLHGTQINTNGASLGQPCSTWAQCQAVDPNSACVNGVCDCLVEGPVQCSWNNTGCHPSTFQCRSSGRCISLALTCNGHPDCEDSSDELFCDRHPCPPGSFPCGSHCISGMFICDGIQHCADGSDEARCQVGEGEECPGNGFRCSNGDCIPEFGFCNSIQDCSDGSDEPVEFCKREFRKRSGDTGNNDRCPFKCGNGKCRSKSVLCTNKNGCGDDSDEAHCTVCRCPPIGQQSNDIGQQV